MYCYCKQMRNILWQKNISSLKFVVIFAVVLRRGTEIELLVMFFFYAGEEDE